MIETGMTVNSIAGLGLAFTCDGFRMTYVIIACLMWGMTAMFSPQYFKHYSNRKRYYVFFVLTFVALIGVFFSADLFTTYVFFELMSLTSYVWVAQDERKESLRAADTYLAVAIIGGLVMLMGLFLLYTGGYSKYLTYGLIFVGFAAKAGVFPLHIWLPKAHPVAPAPASALLSGILTKSGIFGILILSYQLMSGDVKWGIAMLILGLITMVLGALLALFSVNLKRTLACSSMSQIGFIMVGVGVGCMLGSEGVIARMGTFLYMISHSVIKLVLFMVAGVIYCNTHKFDLNDIKGYGRKKPFLMVVFLVGALSIGGIPGFSGYPAKSLIHESIAEIAELTSHLFAKATEWTFMISGGCTIAYMTKLFIAVFVEKNEDAKVQASYDSDKNYVRALSMVALLVPAILLVVYGMLPQFVANSIADFGANFLGVNPGGWYVDYFSFTNLLGFLVSVLIGFTVYFMFVKEFLIRKGRYENLWPEKLDIENAIYRPLLLCILPFVGTVLSRIFENITDGLIVLLRKTIFSDRMIEHEYIEGSIVSHTVGDALDDARKRRLGHFPENVLDTYEHRLAVYEYKRKLNFSIISRSLSFGLVLACMGLLLTIGYLLSYIF